MDIKNRITGEVCFVIDAGVDWVDIFRPLHYKHFIIESLEYCQKEKGLIIYDWVSMSTHLHAIVGSSGENNVSDIWRDFKKFTSKEIINTIKTNPQEAVRIGY